MKLFINGIKILEIREKVNKEIENIRGKILLVLLLSQLLRLMHVEMIINY